MELRELEILRINCMILLKICLKWFSRSSQMYRFFKPLFQALAKNLQDFWICRTAGHPAVWRLVHCWLAWHWCILMPSNVRLGIQEPFWTDLLYHVCCVTCSDVPKRIWENTIKKHGCRKIRKFSCVKIGKVYFEGKLFHSGTILGFWANPMVDTFQPTNSLHPFPVRSGWLEVSQLMSCKHVSPKKSHRFGSPFRGASPHESLEAQQEEGL